MLKPDDPDPALQRIRMMEMLNLDAKAVGPMLSLRKRFPKDEAILTECTRLLHKVKRLDAAVKEITKFLADQEFNKPIDLNIANMLLEILDELQRYDEGIELCNKLEAFPTCKPASSWPADLVVKRGVLIGMSWMIHNGVGVASPKKKKKSKADVEQEAQTQPTPGPAPGPAPSLSKLTKTRRVSKAKEAAADGVPEIVANKTLPEILPVVLECFQCLRDILSSDDTQLTNSSSYADLFHDAGVCLYKMGEKGMCSMVMVMVMTVVAKEFFGPLMHMSGFSTDDILFQLADCLVNEGDYLGAEPLLQQHIGLHPRDKAALALLAEYVLEHSIFMISVNQKLGKTSDAPPKPVKKRKSTPKAPGEQAAEAPSREYKRLHPEALEMLNILYEALSECISRNDWTGAARYLRPVVAYLAGGVGRKRGQGDSHDLPMLYQMYCDPDIRPLITSYRSGGEVPVLTLRELCMPMEFVLYLIDSQETVDDLDEAVPFTFQINGKTFNLDVLSRLTAPNSQLRDICRALGADRFVTLCLWCLHWLMHSELWIVTALFCENCMQTFRFDTEVSEWFVGYRSFDYVSRPDSSCLFDITVPTTPHDQVYMIAIECAFQLNDKKAIYAYLYRLVKNMVSSLERCWETACAGRARDQPDARLPLRPMPLGDLVTVRTDGGDINVLMPAVGIPRSMLLMSTWQRIGSMMKRAQEGTTRVAFRRMFFVLCNKSLERCRALADELKDLTVSGMRDKYEVLTLGLTDGVALGVHNTHSDIFVPVYRYESSPNEYQYFIDYVDLVVNTHAMLLHIQSCNELSNVQRRTTVYHASKAMNVMLCNVSDRLKPEVREDSTVPDVFSMPLFKSLFKAKNSLYWQIVGGDKPKTRKRNVSADAGDESQLPLSSLPSFVLLHTLHAMLRFARSRKNKNRNLSMMQAIGILSAYVTRRQGDIDSNVAYRESYKNNAIEAEIACTLGIVEFQCGMHDSRSFHSYLGHISQATLLTRKAVKLCGDDDRAVQVRHAASAILSSIYCRSKSTKALSILVSNN